MNLFFNPSISEFKKLLMKTQNDLPVHDLVIDYDGEVLIDPQLIQPGLDLDKFKVHVQLRDNSHFQKLFKFLLHAWNNRSQVRMVLQ
jgi:hypothetical protein